MDGVTTNDHCGSNFSKCHRRAAKVVRQKSFSTAGGCGDGLLLRFSLRESARLRARLDPRPVRIRSMDHDEDVRSLLSWLQVFYSQFGNITADVCRCVSRGCRIELEAARDGRARSRPERRRRWEVSRRGGRQLRCLRGFRERASGALRCRACRIRLRLPALVRARTIRSSQKRMEHHLNLLEAVSTQPDVP